MAQRAVTTYWFPVLGSTVLVAAALALLQGPLRSAEEPFTALKYRLRGPIHPDTNIVLVTIDDNAVRSLGWPVKRNFHALLVKVLTELQAKAVGLEVLFEDQKPEYVEYDDLLARMATSSGVTVLTAYFSAVRETKERPEGASSLGPVFDFPGVHSVPLSGHEIHLPYRLLLAGAAGVGHVNLSRGNAVPVLIRMGRSVVPAFGMEVLRVYLGAGRESVWFDDDRVSFRLKEGTLDFKVEHGVAPLFYPGSLDAYAAYPLFEVLRSYDALRAAQPAQVPLASLKGKIVLVGVVAEGRSQFISTPVDARLPSIALHAAFLDNALRGRFLHSTPPWLVTLLSGLLAAGCLAAALVLRRPLHLLAPLLVLLLLLAVSLVLFISAAVLFPVAPVLAVSVVSTLAGLLSRQHQERELVERLEREHTQVLAQLRDREHKVAELERELREGAAARVSDRTAELLEEIRRYKSEIHTLSSRADDMVPYTTKPTESSDVAAEFEGMIYARAGKMTEVVEFVGKIATSTAPVLIIGESGTGKELVARAIHRKSRRSEGPFVAVNCGALSESLLESELFGHEKGAFTGAVKERLGRFERAQGGTIFLDEIGEISENFQLKLLRVLQEGEMERVGGTETVSLDVRVIAATNKDLKEQVRSKAFREDLYYRLNVLTVSLPPLRERSADIPLLAAHLAQREGDDLRISRNVMDAFCAYAWPGNVRELESTMKRAALFARADRRTMITVKDLSEDVAATVRGGMPLEEQILERFREKGFSRSSVSETADELGRLNRGTVAEYLRGECLRAFVEQGWDVEKAVASISLSGDEDVKMRVRKRLLDYLSNLSDAADASLPTDEVRRRLRVKLKNLPQRYHTFAEQCVVARHEGRWTLP